VIFVHGITGSGPNFLLQPSGYGWFRAPETPLFNLLEANGYEEGKTLFRFSYNWLASNSTSAATLGPYIEQVKDGIESRIGVRPEHVTLIAHSMGGFVTRVYVSSAGTDGLDQFFTIGSPYAGSVEMIARPTRGSAILNGPAELLPTWQAVYDQNGVAVPNNGGFGYNPWVQANVWPAPAPDIAFYSQQFDTAHTVTRTEFTYYDPDFGPVTDYAWARRSFLGGDQTVDNQSATTSVGSTRIVNGTHAGEIPLWPTGSSRGAGGIVEAAAPQILSLLKASSVGGPENCYPYKIEITNTPPSMQIPACSTVSYQIRVLNRDTGQPVTQLRPDETLEIEVSGSAMDGTDTHSTTDPTYNGTSPGVKRPGDVRVNAKVIWDRTWPLSNQTLGDNTETTSVTLAQAPTRRDRCGNILTAEFDEAACNWKWPNSNTTCLPDDNRSVAGLSGLLNVPASSAPFTPQPTAFTSIYPAATVTDTPPITVPAGIAVLDNGFANALLSLLTELGIPADRVPADFSPEMVSRYRALVIPSGGLSGYAQSDLMRERLAQFAQKGGVIVAFAQEYGQEFGLLPGGQLQGYGYDEDVNCQADSSRVATFAPMLIGQAREVLSLNVDGFFTRWPTDTEVLLTREANGMPDMVTYPYGAGQVVATTAYADMARYQGQGTREEKQLVRDLMNWALDPVFALDRYGTGDTVTLPITATNRTLSQTTALAFTIYDQTGNWVFSSNAFTVTLNPSETKVLTSSVPISTLVTAGGNAYGQWRLYVRLLNADGNSVQSEETYRFASERFTSAESGHGYPGRPYALSVTSESEEYPRDSQATFTYNVFNHSDVTQTFTVQWYMIHHSWYNVPGYQGQLTVTVPAQGMNSVSSVLERVVDLDRVRVHLYLGNTDVAYAERGFWMGPASVAQRLATDKAEYDWGDRPQVVVTTTNQVRSPLTVTAALTAQQPDGQLVFTDTHVFSLAAGATQSYSLTLQPVTHPGNYRLQVQNTLNDQPAVRTTANILLPPLRAALTADLPPLFGAGQMMTLTALNVGGGPLPTSTLRITLTQINGSLIWADQQTVLPLAVQQVVTTYFDTGAIGTFPLGDYRLLYGLTASGTTAASGSVDYPARLLARVLFDRDAYRVREALSMTVAVSNMAQLGLSPLLNISVPDLGWSYSQPLVLPTNSSWSQLFTFTLPVTLTSGAHPAYAALALGETVTRTNSFYVLPANVQARADVGPHIAGAALPVTLTNGGGVDTSATYTLSLRDASNNRVTIGSDLSGTAVLANQATAISGTIPITLASGNYRLAILGAYAGGTQPIDQDLAVSISGADVQATAAAGPYIAGSTLPVTLTNHGAVDATVTYALSLQANDGQLNIGQDLIGVLVPANSAIVVTGTIPAGARSGGYGLHVDGAYTPGSRPVKLVQLMQVLGPSIELVGRTDRPEYLTLNIITVTGGVTNTGTPLPQGELGLAITRDQDAVRQFDIYDTSSSSISSNDVTAATVGPEGSIWLGSTPGGYGSPYLDRLHNDLTTWDHVSLPGTINPSVIHKLAADQLGQVWLATDNGAARLNSDGTTWTTYQSLDSGLVADWVNTVAVDAAGNAWFGTSNGLNKLTTAGEWFTYTTANSGLVSDYIYAVAIDVSGTAWIGTDAGLNQLTPTGTWITYTTGNSGLLSDWVYDIAFDPAGAVWLATPPSAAPVRPNAPLQNEGGISALLTNGSWLTYTTSNSGLLSSAITLVLVDNYGRKWVGYDGFGISILSTDNTVWEAYATPDLGGDVINALALAPNGNVWLGTQSSGIGADRPKGIGIGGNGGATRAFYVPGSSDVLWTRSVTTSLSSPDTFVDVSSVAAAALNATGRLSLHTTFTSTETGQVLAEDLYHFYVYSGTLALTLQPDRLSYRPGQIMTVTGILSNTSVLTQTDQWLRVNVNGATRYSAGPFGLAPNEGYAYALTSTAPFTPGAVSFEAVSPYVSANQVVEVNAPQGEAVLSVPSVAGQAPFSATVTVTNTGVNDAIVQVSIADGPAEWLALAPGQFGIVAHTVSIAADAVVTATVRGDLDFDLSQAVTWGEAASIGLSAPSGETWAGPTAVSYTITNAGMLPFSVPYTLTLDSAIIASGQVLLQPGQAAADSLNVTAPPGGHVLTATVPNQQAVANWTAVPLNTRLIEIEAVHAPAQLIGQQPVSVTVVNTGTARVDGTVLLHTAFAAIDLPFDLEPGQMQTLTTALDSVTASASGSYTLTAEAWANGARLDQANTVFTIPAPDWQVVAPPVALVPGVPLTLPFRLHNAGGSGAPFDLSLDLDGLFIAQQAGWAGPDETVTATFVISLPIDVEARTATGNYRLDDVTTPFTFTIAGYQLAMSGQLSTNVAQAGQPVTATIWLTDTSGLGQSIPLGVRLGGVGVPQTTTVSLHNTAQVQFVFPAPDQDALLSYGIYHLDGRSLLLDALRLYVAGDPRGEHPLVVYPDRVVYQPGDTVHLTARASVTGTLHWRALGLSGTIDLIPNIPANFDIGLPSDLVAGTQQVTYGFTSTDGRTVDDAAAFEVNGDRVAVRRVDLDWQAATCSGAVSATLKLDSRQALMGVSVVYRVLAPDGAAASTAQTRTLDVPGGVTWVTLTPISFASGQGGTHRLEFQVLQAGRELAWGTQAFDVAAPALLGVSVPRPYYRTTWFITGTASLLNNSGVPVTLTLRVDGNLAGQQMVSGTGYIAAPLNVGTLSAGPHTLTVTSIGQSGCTSEADTPVFVASLPQAQIIDQAPDGFDGWHVTTPTMYLRTDETLSPVTGYYAWDGGPQQQDDGRGLSIPADGIHDLAAWVTTADGSVGPIVTTTLLIDRQAPQVSASVTGQSIINVTLIATDTTSGIGWIGYRVDSGAWQTYTVPLSFAPVQTMTLDYQARDVAGNSSTLNSLSLAPTTHTLYLPIIRR
jgi:hypothetical protein